MHKSKGHLDKPPGMTDLDYHQLVKLGESIKKEYTRLRRLQKPGYKGESDRWNQEFWFKVARFVQYKQLNPDQWVEFLFRVTHPSYPLPNMLLSVSKASEFAGSTESAVAISCAESMVKIDNHLVSRELKFGRTIEDVLTDRNLQLNPLFSYMVALSGGKQELAEKIRPVAREFLATYPQYRKTSLGRFLPEEI